MPTSPIDSPHAVLLHGLGRSSRSMVPIERALVGKGYRVRNVGYASRSTDVVTLAVDVARQITEWRPSGSFDIVTHSLGGILVRLACANGALSSKQIRRVVMLGPPNNGSELADVLPWLPIIGRAYRRFTGPAGMQLGTDADSLTNSLPPVDFELGVIAGNRSLNPLFSAILGEENDGKVRVSSARVDGMRDFIVVRHSHPLLMAAPSVIAQVLHFLDTGCFHR
jgi:pimeloyl-ACP methyl ester carboxylesterase